MKGKVKWFDGKKGYGFITGEDGKEVFVHYSGIVKDGFKALNEKQEVEYELGEGSKGIQAINVNVVETHSYIFTPWWTVRTKRTVLLFPNAVPTETKDAPRRSETELLAGRHTTDCLRPHSGKTGRQGTKVDFCPDRPEFCRGLFRVY